MGTTRTRTPKRSLPWRALVVTCCGLGAALLVPAAAQARQLPFHTWYVSAAAPAGGDGSAQAPFSSLAAVEAASGPGDTIVIDPSPLTVPPLDGGITLQTGQRLVGGGPPVVTRSGANPRLTSLPRITNSTNATNNGDAVDLADDTSVSNVVIDGSYRGGIYGDDVTGVSVRGNDVSGQNTSGTDGFQVLPFYLETYTAGKAISPTPVSLSNGWAGIMIDGSATRDNVSITDNFVHNGVCGDGIDLRAMGTANITAQVTGNLVTGLKQCSDQQSLEGIGTQASGTSTLRANLDGNTEENNGNAGANADSLFVNLADSGTLIETIDHNTYTSGIGGASTNGFEYLLSNGNAVGHVTILNSTFVDDPGDMLEEFDRGIGSTQTLTLDNVLVNGTTITGGVPSYADPPGTAAVPDNTGECLGIGSVGSGDQTLFTMRDSTFENCDNNGIEVTNNHVTGDGTGNPQLVSLDIEHSKITGTRYYGIWFNGLTSLNQLRVKMQDSDLSTAGGVEAGFDQQPTGSTPSSVIDLGGGELGSRGGNCIYGGTIYDLESTGYPVTAEHDWWGSPAGPAPGSVSSTPPGSIADGQPLRAVPPACAAHRGR